MMQVTRIVFKEEEVPSAKKQAIRDLKELLWKTQWMENIDLPQARIKVTVLKDNVYKITAEI